jgi:hypothetical protein
MEMTSGVSQMRSSVSRTMIPAGKRKGVYVNTGMTVLHDVLEEAAEIVRAHRAKSKNWLLGSFLSIMTKLYKRLEHVESKIEAYEKAHVPLEDADPESQNKRRAEALAQLIEKGLDCQDVDCGGAKKKK